MKFDFGVLKLSLFVSFVFFVLDYVLHYFSLVLPGLDYLPANYFLFKALSVPVILYFLLVFVKGRNYLLVSGIAGLLLQVRYYFVGGYDVGTNLLMFVVHSGLLFLSFMLVDSMGLGK
jgi:hypothetical protein